MHALLLQEALLDMGWVVQLVTLDALPICFRFFPHLVLRLANLFAAPSGFFLKGKLISLFYRIFFPIENCELVIFEDIYLASKCLPPSVSILHAVWSDNLQGMRFSASVVDKLKLAEVNCLLRLPCPVATVSSEYKSYLLNHHFVDRDIPSLACVPLGVNLPRIASFRKPRNSKIPHSLVFCGACIERKNLFFLLNVFQSLVAADNSFRLTIIGDGPLLSGLKTFSETRCLPVFFKGRLCGDALYEELSLHDVCVHPSIKESFSFALLEAKLLGLSTVAYHGLEVPAEFIDVSVSSFDIASWVASVREALELRSEPDLSAYSSALMVKRLISLAKKSL
jgi:glycosyltransferase involved in cell wall biosynthesis